MVERINYKLLTLTYIALQRGIPDRSEKIVSNLSLPAFRSTVKLTDF